VVRGTGATTGALGVDLNVLVLTEGLEVSDCLLILTTLGVEMLGALIGGLETLTGVGEGLNVVGRLGVEEKLLGRLLNELLRVEEKLLLGRLKELELNERLEENDDERLEEKVAAITVGLIVEK
jgi:hypothetical protein